MAGETTGLVFSHISRISRRKWHWQIVITSDTKPIVALRGNAGGLIFGKLKFCFALELRCFGGPFKCTFNWLWFATREVIEMPSADPVSMQEHSGNQLNLGAFHLKCMKSAWMSHTICYKNLCSFQVEEKTFSLTFCSHTWVSTWIHKILFHLKHCFI